MLRALYALGRYIEENEDMSKFESLLDLDRLSNCEKIIAIRFEVDNSDVEYLGAHEENYDENKGRKMLYSYGSSRGGDYSPTSQITRLHKTVEKKENENTKKDTLQRIWDYGWFKKYGDSSDFTEKIKNEYRKKEDKIRKDVYEIYDGLDSDKKGNAVLTLKLKKDKQEYFIDEFKVFKKALKNIAINSWKNKHEETSKGESTCTLCKKEKEVLGFAFPFPFYTLHKKGFAPSFDVSRSYQKIPICEDCAFYLQLGRNYLENNNFLFNIPYQDRIRYYVLLEHTIKTDGKEIYSNILPRIEQAKLKNEVDFPLISVEDYITSVIMKEEPSSLNLHFLFYTKPNQAQQRIEQFITDISPSYLNEIKRKIQKLKKGMLFNLDNLKKLNLEEYNIRIKNKENMEERGYLESLILKILPDRDEISDLSQTGLEYATTILKREKISYDKLINMFLKEVRRRFRNEEYERQYALNSLLFLNLLFELNIVGGKKMKEVGGFWETEINNVDEFFEEYSEAFDSSEKRAAFLQGVVTKLFIGIQANQRGSTPFRKKLGGLRLDEKKLGRLYSELENKFAQYDRELAYNDLRKTASKYLVEAENSGWEISNDVISYYFSLGLNLGRMFKPPKEEGENDE